MLQLPHGTAFARSAGDIKVYNVINSLTIRGYYSGYKFQTRSTKVQKIIGRQDEKEFKKIPWPATPTA
jgi:hypothetical protein